MPDVTEWVRHARFDLTRAATELAQLQARVHQVFALSSDGAAGDAFERRRHLQLMTEAVAHMDHRVDGVMAAFKQVARALPVSGTDALEATRCLQLARDARRAIKRAEQRNDRERRILVDTQLACLRGDREGLREALDGIARDRRAHELRFVRGVARMAVRLLKKLDVTRGQRVPSPRRSPEATRC